MGYRLWVIGLVVLFFSSCAQRENAHKQVAPMKVKTMVVMPQDGSTASRYVGTIEPAQTTPLSLQTTGRVVSVEVKNGQRVTAGQTIIKVDDTQARNALQGAEAALQHAQDGYDRVAAVHQKGVVSDQKMVEIASQLQQAKSLYEAAKQQLEECTLTAPCDGVVDGLEAVNGQTIIPGTKLCTILDVSAYSVRFTVPENEIGSLADKGQVECAAVGAVLPITVTEKGITANAVTHTYEVVARINGRAEGLKAGMVAKVKVKGERLAISDIVIPAKCILLKPEGHTVWVMEQGTAVRRAIAIDGYRADGVRVASGLTIGDTLITEGYQKLYNGCKVENE